MKSTDGPLNYVPDAWVHEVQLALRGQHMSCVQLARHIGSSTATVTKLLEGGFRQSRLVRPISALLGIAMPAAMPALPGKGDELPGLGYARHGERVSLTMSDDDYSLLLVLLGYAAGHVMAGSVFALMNRLNAGNPAYTPRRSTCASTPR